MGLLYGLVGSILGGATAFLFVSSAVDGDGLGIFLGMIIWGLVGLITGAILGGMLALRLLRYVTEHQQGSKGKRKNVLIVSCSLFAVPALVAAMLWGGWRAGEPPSDQQLIINFRLRRPAFDKLAQMKLADKGLLEVGDGSTQPSDPKAAGVSPEQITKYRWLLELAGVHDGLGSDGLAGMDFICWAQGGATSSDRDKGYAYLSVPPKQTANSLDQLPPDGLHQREVYRHIEGCWYLYYDYLPG